MGPSSSRGREIAGMKSPRRSPGSASATCPRISDIFPSSHCPPEPAARPKDRPPIPAAGPMEEHVRRCFPAYASARRHGGWRPVRRRAADADYLPYPDGRSRFDHGGRADRRPGAAARGNRWPGCSTRSPGGACRSSLWSRSSRSRCVISARVYVMGRGEIVFEGTPDDLRENDKVRQEWLEV